MANSIANLAIITIGTSGYIFDLPVLGATHIFEGTLVSQVNASGFLVPFSTAGSTSCAGVATHEQDNSLGANGDKRVRVESMRAFAFNNGAGGAAFADTDLIGAVVYGSDDHTVGKTGSLVVGFFMGFEADGKVRVFINPALARAYAALA